MKGKKHSEKTKQKISASLKGRPRLDLRGKPRSEKTKQKISATMTGERNPMYGKHHSAETLAKMSTALTGECHPNYGRHLSAETRAKQSIVMMGRPRPDLSGPNHPNWRGGISFEIYPIGWTEHLRDMIRKRDNYICVLCGKVQTIRRHSVHHINYDKKDIRPENLVTLCIRCHLKTGSDRKYWTDLFNEVYVPDFPKERITKNESNC